MNARTSESRKSNEDAAAEEDRQALDDAPEEAEEDVRVATEILEFACIVAAAMTVLVWQSEYQEPVMRWLGGISVLLWLNKRLHMWRANRCQRREKCLAAASGGSPEAFVTAAHHSCR